MINEDSSIQLRQYQASAIHTIYEEWRRGNTRVMLQLPTGGGKTVIFSAIAHDFLRSQGRILVLVHREELLTQAQQVLESICGVRVGVIKAGFEPEPLCVVQVASVQSLVRRDMPDARLVIVDEAHHSVSESYCTILENYPNACVLGVSATPIRTDGSGFDGLFNALVSNTSVKKLIAEGHLSKYKLYADDNPIATKGIRTTAGDFDSADLARDIDAIALSGNLTKMYQKHAQGKRCLVFAVNCQHSRAIAKRYQDSGIPAEHLDGKTPNDERRAILERFRTGQTLVVSNVGILTEGFNLPSIEAVQIARPTKSLSLWLQMVGRSLRPAEGKSHAVILDHTDNYLRLGMPCSNHIWTLEGVEPNNKTKLRKKKNGEIIEQELLEIIEGDAQLREISEKDLAKLTLIFEVVQLDRLFEICEAKNYKKSWIGFQFLESKPSLEALKICQKRLGYKQGWAKIKFGEYQANIKEVA